MRLKLKEYCCANLMQMKLKKHLNFELNLELNFELKFELNFESNFELPRGQLTELQGQKKEMKPEEEQ